MFQGDSGGVAGVFSGGGGGQFTQGGKAVGAIKSSDFEVAHFTPCLRHALPTQDCVDLRILYALQGKFCTMARTEKSVLNAAF